jgi:hypothetical protein
MMAKKTRTEGRKRASTANAQGPQWTVMVFMGADTIEGNAPLVDAADADLAEMAAVGSGGPLKVFAQVHGKGLAPQRSYIGVTPMRDVPIDQRDPADGHALENFIKWALGTAGHDPDNRYHYTMLVLWGHAYDFAFGRQRLRSGSIDALDFAELSDVLKRLQDQFGSGSAKLDILAFDACDLATVEVACQFQRFAKYLLGSEIGIPIPGWPYDRVLSRLRHPKVDLMGPPELGSYVVRRFCESYPASKPVSLSLLDLERASDLFGISEVLGLTLTSAIGDADTRDRIVQSFRQSQTVEGKPYVDVADLCLNLVRDSGDAFVAEAAKALGDFLVSPMPPLVGMSDEGRGKPFVVENGRNAGSTARLNGISIYAPHVAPENDFDAVQHLYLKFVFAQETRWSELVHTLARLS